MRMLLVGLLGAAVLAGGAQAAQPKPEDMFVKLYRAEGLGQYGRAWDLLHPGQQKIANRDKFMGCMEDSDAFDFDLVSIKVVDRYTERLNSAGVPQHTATALTLKITVKMDGKKESFTDTNHAIWTGTRWSWVLTSSSIAAYKRGACPT